MTIIIVSGTPGTGKTTVAKCIARHRSYRYVDVNELIKQHDLCDDYDQKRRCIIVDADKLSKVLKIIIAEDDNVVIDSHMSQVLPPTSVDLCIITKCSLDTLKKRLQKRKWGEQKIRENLDAEIFDNCLTEAEEAGHKIIIVDTTQNINEEELIRKII